MKKMYMITDSCWTQYALFEMGVFASKEAALKKAEELAIEKAMNWTGFHNDLWKRDARVERKGDEFWIYHKGCSNVYGVVEVNFNE